MTRGLAPRPACRDYPGRPAHLVMRRPSVPAGASLVAVPVIKMATRTELANRWFDLMDINAGTIATGEETIEDVGLKLFEFILDVASGRKKTFSDQWGLHNQLAVFNPAPVT